jgi:hypothetical protein
MFEVNVKTAVASDDEITPEVEKHRLKAEETLGPGAKLVSMETATLPVFADNTLKIVGEQIYVATRWKGA